MIIKRLMIVLLFAVIMQVRAADEQTQRVLQFCDVVQRGAPLEEVMVLIDRMNVNAVILFVHTRPCHVAARWNRGDIIEILYQKGANVNATDDDKETPLHFACKHGALSAVEALLKCRASLKRRDKWARTPLSFARKNGHQAIVKLLEDYDRIPDIKEPEGN